MPERKDNSSALGGIILMLLCHGVYLVVTFLLMFWKPVYTMIGAVLNPGQSVDDYVAFTYWAWLIMAMSFVQGFYAVPLYNRLKKTGEVNAANGIAIVGTFTVFLLGPLFAAALRQAISSQ